MRVLTIPLRADSAGIEIHLPNGALTPADWDVLTAVLTAMRPALVQEPGATGE